MSNPSPHRLIVELEQGSAVQFDPVRYAFIQSLVARLEQPVHQNNKVLFGKLRRAVDAYQTDLEACRRDAKPKLKRLCRDFPDHADAATALFAQCQFRQLDNLRQRLSAAQSKCEGLDQLRDISRLIEAGAKADNSEIEQPSFEDTLAWQEERARLSICAVDPLNNGSGGRSELRSMKMFRESVRHFKIDKIIDRAINTWPENPGPHNPHMLTIKAMVRMHELSPQYLRRLAKQIETLLLLEKNANKWDVNKNS